jgi:UDP-N-acetylglucosamine 3-dehydrogenase
MNVGLIGAGMRGIHHANALKESPGIDFLAVCDLDFERAKEVAEKYRVEAYGSVDEMLARKDLESVVIVTQAKDHAELSIRALEAGKHVLCEKPIADCIEDAYRMLDATESSGLKAAVGFQRRFDPCFWTLKRIAQELDPLQVTLTGQRGIFLEKYLRSGSAYGIMDAACHQVDLVNWLIGRPPRAVCGSVRSGVFTPTAALDTISIQIEYGDEDDKRTGNILASMGGPGLKNFCHVVGKGGNAEIRDDGTIGMRRVTYDDRAGGEKERQVTSTSAVDCEVPYSSDATLALESAFADYVRGKETGIATFKDGFEALLILEATLVSSRKATKVKLMDLIPG